MEWNGSVNNLWECSSLVVTGASAGNEQEDSHLYLIKEVQHALVLSDVKNLSVQMTQM